MTSVQDDAGDDPSPAAAVPDDGARTDRDERLTVPASGHPGPLRKYVGLVWIGDEPGLRFQVMAEGSRAASRLVDDHFGEGHVVSLWNEEDADRLR